MRIKKRAQNKFKNNPRFQSLIILTQIEEAGDYSNEAIHRVLAANRLDKKDQDLLVQLVYGCLQTLISLDYYLEPFIRGKTLEPWLLWNLRLACYQFVYLDRIPDHAIIHEAVEIAKVNGHRGLGKLVNAILRNFQRQPLRDLPSAKDPLYRFSIQYSVPQWILKIFHQGLDLTSLDQLLASLLDPPYLTGRIVDQETSRGEYIHQLESEGFQASPSPLSPLGIRVQGGNLIHSQAYKQGQITIQDEAAQMVVPAGGLQGHHQVLDACAAPGGKTTHIAQGLQAGRVLALDLTEEKIQKVEDNSRRLKLDSKIQTKVQDARDFVPPKGTEYDIIYLDVPCSGLGLLRRKPEIKYRQSPDGIRQLIQLQASIIDWMAQWVKPGGELVYSTCTLNPGENEDQVANFLRCHPDFTLQPPANQDDLPGLCLKEDGSVLIWPHQLESDGFFIARLVKNKE